ncbi:hypothetical protein Zm00014a_042711 [Zea mays]|uniref:Uncharacterized protein n=1 Tax=Zea mays TaxID=4577 RepID=A0A3L6EQX5_MAIZE|nr:hypothetical protein Zm00014a_042711 [Zea mays]
MRWWGGPALAMGCVPMVVLCSGWRRGDWVAIPSMTARRGLRLGRGGYGRGIHGVWEERLDDGWSCASLAMGFLRAGLQRGVDSARGCVSFYGSDEIFPSMADTLIGEGITARTMRMQG